MLKLYFIISSIFLIVSSINVVFAGREDPFTPKASLIRYWKKEISNDLPQPSFLLNKASPLTAVQSATFSKLAAQNSLAAHLPSFCTAAGLFCYPDLAPSLEKHTGDVNFKEYQEQNFTNYGTKAKTGSQDSFDSYSADLNLGLNSFRRYSRDSLAHDEKFSNYAPDNNVPDESFNTYGTKAVGGNSDFKKYAEEANVPSLRFTSYNDAGTQDHTFSSYSENSNSGGQSFTSYSKHGGVSTNSFISYSNNTNVAGSSFSNYDENGKQDFHTFTSYGENGNVPENNFKTYGKNAFLAHLSFKNYRDQSNVGDEFFTSYGRGKADATDAKFTNYGKSFNEGSDTFTGYGVKPQAGQRIGTFGFKTYGVNTTFKEYADKKGDSFASYTKRDSAAAAELAEMKASGKLVNKWVEPGKFFRESSLKTGTIMPMPDIRDKMPKRSFLPPNILSKLPFSTSKLGEMKQIFHAGDNSSMEGMIVNALNECERAPSRGESKRCVGSVEDMIDFATSILGRNIVVRTTESTAGSKGNVMVGNVKGINGGKVTKSVSCHQSLFPYLLYYCHSVPKVRVYEADLLDPKTKSKINHGTAICHIDTSSWGPTHGAFLALGSGPGKIEVCHWIFENDMTWAVAD